MYVIHVHVVVTSAVTALVKRTFREHCLVFIQTKRQAHRMHIVLGLMGIRVGELHGNLTQPQVRVKLSRREHQWSRYAELSCFCCKKILE